MTERTLSEREQSKEKGGPVNLDCCTTEPNKLRWIGVLLQEYCTYKSYAMENRAKGKVDMALTYENKCEEIYKTLPAEVRW